MSFSRSLPNVEERGDTVFFSLRDTYFLFIMTKLAEKNIDLRDYQSIRFLNILKSIYTTKLLHITERIAIVDRRKNKLSFKF